MIGAVSTIAACAVGLSCAAYCVAGRMPSYPPALGNDNSTEKITGRWLVETAAELPQTITIYGSSELRTFEISTHPSNFFAGERSGFQVNLVGRGSCQSLIHAMSIAASGDSLSGTKVVLITSPQSYVEGGIAPELFMANFSEEQYLALMSDDSIPDEMKLRFSQRVDELFDEYAEATGDKRDMSASSLLAKYASSDVMRTVLAPYTGISELLCWLRDRAESKALIESFEPVSEEVSAEPIDWEQEELDAVAEAEVATDNNDFGILNGYYNTYIGRRLDVMEGQDSGLSYSVSEEYGDLRLLLDVCELKGIEPLFVHVPLHGEWSDYTGFTAERREEYYSNVREIVSEYSNVTLLDLTGNEYEEYYLCDIMHLGWKGWLDVDKALVEFFEQD